VSESEQIARKPKLALAGQIADCAPNRNGILHGSRKHLDYGTEVNSLRPFHCSPLSFIVSMIPRHKSIS
jgi:hypothetical protein